MAKKSNFDQTQYPGQTEGKQVNAPILDFRNRIGDLARPNLFQVEIGFPSLVDEGSPATGATLAPLKSVSKKEQVLLPLVVAHLPLHFLPSL